LVTGFAGTAVPQSRQCFRFLVKESNDDDDDDDDGCVAGLGSKDEVELVNKLFDGYNSLIRPVQNLTTKVKVEVQLALIQIIDVVRICTVHHIVERLRGAATIEPGT